MRAILAAACLGLLLGSTVVRGQTPVFGWEYARNLQPEAFLLSADGGGTHVTWQTVPSAPGACGPGSSPDAYCTRLPSCPPLGPVTLTVVAVVASTPSPPSPPLPCQVTMQTPCTLACTNSQGAPAGETVGLMNVPTTAPPSTVFATQNGRVIVDIPPHPTQDPVALPALQAMPALPLFQPATSRAPL